MKKEVTEVCAQEVNSTEIAVDIKDNIIEDDTLEGKQLDVNYSLIGDDWNSE